MPSINIGAVVGVVALLFVVLYGMGVFDTTANSNRYVAGACDISEANIGSLVSLTGTGALGNGLYDSLQSPVGTFYQVPANYELSICQLMVNNIPDAAKDLLHLHVGYGDEGVSAVAGPPAGVVVMAHLPANQAVEEGIVYFDTVIGPFPEGTYPFVQYTPGDDWEAFALGVERKVSD